MSVPTRRPDDVPPDGRPHGTDADGLNELDRTHAGARRRFLAVNGAAFLGTALLSGTAVDVFAADRPANRMPLGAALGAAQLTLLLLTSWWYDRTLRRVADPLADRRRLSAAQPPHASPADAMPGWTYPSPGRPR